MTRAWRASASALAVVAATLLTLTCAQTPVDICPGPNDVFINAGGENEHNVPPGTAIGYRCDNATYVTSSFSWEYTTPENVGLTGGCTNQYLSHRVAGAQSNVLEYTIPVDEGSYTVHVMFMETFWTMPGKREFTLSVNGEFLQPNGVNNVIDLFQLGGKNVPLIYTVPNVTVDSATAASSGIVIQANRLPMMDNPMISGIAIIGIDGSTANSVVGSTNIAGCGLNSLPVTSPLPSLSSTPSISVGATASPSATASASAGAVSPSATPSAPPSPLPSPVVITPTTLCPGPDDVFINAGGFNVAESGFRCDNATYVTSASSWEYKTPQQVALTGPCTEHYLSHRVAGGASNTLEYTVPVPPGMYTVYLMFMETFWNEAGKREFNASVNGNFIQPNGVNETVDLFLLAGKNVPYYVTVENIVVTASSQQIVIQANRIPMMDNPIISGIGIQGSDGVAANALVGDKGLNGCGDAEPSVAPTSPSPTPSAVVATTPEPATAQVDVCPGLADVFFNTGAPLVGEWRCDVGVAQPNSNVFSVPSAGLVDQGCRDHYLSQRFTFGPSLTYTIPVGAGTYNVYLMFMETFFTAANLRTFSVSINGALVNDPKLTNGVLDVWSAAGGINKELLLNITGVTATNNIVVTLGKVVQNPMISGIGIVGTGATDVLKTSYIDSCDALPLPVDCSDQGTFTDPEDAGHVAHAQSGGPYVETDFDKDNKAIVQLDGLQSHSHASAPQFNGNGAITNYKWTWTDASNPAADADGVVTVEGATPAPEFPLGTTEIELEVNDQFCNKAKESTTVTVNSATVPGAYCYLYDFLQSSTTDVPLPFSVLEQPRPQFGFVAGAIDIGATTFNNFENLAFKENSYGVRCIFSVDVSANATLQYQIVHSGPMIAYQGSEVLAISNSTITDTITTTASKFFAAGTYDWQILYFRNSDVPPQLSFQFATTGLVVPQNIVRHDASTTLPVISAMTPATALATEIVQIFGSAFVNGVNVKFGDVAAEVISGSAGSLQVRVPEQQGNEEVVDVHVETLAGSSNGVQFVYGNNSFSCQPISFETTTLKQNGVDFGINNIAVVKYGPDGRMYLGSTQSLLHILELSADLVVTSNYAPKNIKDSPTSPNRWVLGLAFNPAAYNPAGANITMYFSTSTMYWAHNPPQFSDTEGWRNGKVQSITIQAGGTYNDDVTDVVTGLPVTDHDHGVNFLQFLPNGKLIIAVGGFTNGGISVVGDGLGGIPAPDFAGALIECDPLIPSDITYFNNSKLSTNKSIVTSGSCSPYAVGLRNTFAGELHTNGELYVTDNGPNQNFGAFSTDCNGGLVPDKNNPDKFFKIVPGACHGHPHLLRGQTDPKQCVFNSGDCVQALSDTLESSTNGVLEYRSNWFVGKLKGNMLLSKYSLGPGKQGAITRVQLDETNGNLPNTPTKGLTPLFQQDSGLSIVEGPRGEIIMSRVFKNSFLVLKPVCVGGVSVPYFIGVHPRRGPAGGGQLVTISGLNFGTAPTALFGSDPCTEVTVINTQTFTCKTPPNMAGKQVKVTVADEATGETLATEGSDYWYW